MLELERETLREGGREGPGGGREGAHGARASTMRWRDVGRVRGSAVAACAREQGSEGGGERGSEGAREREGGGGPAVCVWENGGGVGVGVRCGLRVRVRERDSERERERGPGRGGEGAHGARASTMHLRDVGRVRGSAVAACARKQVSEGARERGRGRGGRVPAVCVWEHTQRRPAEELDVPITALACMQQRRARRTFARRAASSLTRAHACDSVRGWPVHACARVCVSMRARVRTIHTRRRARDRGVGARALVLGSRQLRWRASTMRAIGHARERGRWGGVTGRTACAPHRSCGACERGSGVRACSGWSAHPLLGEAAPAAVAGGGRHRLCRWWRSSRRSPATRIIAIKTQQ